MYASRKILRSFKTGQTVPDPAFQCFDPVIDLSTRESKEI